MVFRAMVARISPTCASVAFCCAVALSYSVRAMTPSSTSCFMRAKLMCARSRWASIAASWARSCRVSSSTSTSPAFTALPESKAMRATVPGRSALTVTPCTAAAVPMTFRVAGHFSCFATIVVTAVGGGWKPAPCATAVLICLNFTKPRPPSSVAATASIRIIRFAMSPSRIAPCGRALQSRYRTPRWVGHSYRLTREALQGRGT